MNRPSIHTIIQLFLASSLGLGTSLLAWHFNQLHSPSEQLHCAYIDLNNGTRLSTYSTDGELKSTIPAQSSVLVRTLLTDYFTSNIPHTYRWAITTVSHTAEVDPNTIKLSIIAPTRSATNAKLMITNAIKYLRTVQTETPSIYLKNPTPLWILPCPSSAIKRTSALSFSRYVLLGLFIPLIFCYARLRYFP